MLAEATQTQTDASPRRRLLELEAELSREVEQRRSELADPHAATSNTFVAGSEGAITTADDDRAVALLGHEARVLREVRDALVRLDTGRYGQCDGCGQVIGAARLAALPMARRCLDCQRLSEATSGGRQVPHG